MKNNDNTETKNRKITKKSVQRGIRFSEKIDDLIIKKIDDEEKKTGIRPTLTQVVSECVWKQLNKNGN